MQAMPGEKRLVSAQQLAIEHGIPVGPDATVTSLVAQIMGAPPREVSGVRPHPHGLEVVMRDGSRYIICVRGAPDAEGRAGVLFAAPLKYPVSLPVFASKRSKPVAEPKPKPKRRLRRERPAPPDPAAAAAAAAWQADPIGVAKAELAEVEERFIQFESGLTSPNFNDLAKLKRERVLAQARLREAKSIVAAPGLLAEETRFWSRCYQWSRDMCAATSVWQAEETRRRWVEQWPDSGRFTAHTCQIEFEVATSWLSMNAPDILARLVAEDVEVSA